MSCAVELRARFKALPSEQLAARQDFAIRVWRALSWLELAEERDRADFEGRFIFGWIAFNALYGRLHDNLRPWGDREAMGTFLAHIWRLDDAGRIRRLLGKRQLAVLKLIEDKYLSVMFWEQGESAAVGVKKQLRESMARFGTPNMLPVLQLLFERLYVMRLQVFHGASTKGSRLNRRALQGSGNILLELLPEMLDVMIGCGIDEDWGAVCFPPTGQAPVATPVGR